MRQDALDVADACAFRVGDVERVPDGYPPRHADTDDAIER
jgi:hypothetical protein